MSSATSIRNLFELIRFGNSKIDFYADGTDTMMILDAPLNAPLVLKSELADRIEFQVNDDLTGLIKMNISVGGRAENRGLYGNTRIK